MDVEGGVFDDVQRLEISERFVRSLRAENLDQHLVEVLQPMREIGQPEGLAQLPIVTTLRTEQYMVD